MRGKTHAFGVGDVTRNTSKNMLRCEREVSGDVIAVEKKLGVQGGVSWRRHSGAAM